MTSVTLSPCVFCGPTWRFFKVILAVSILPLSRAHHPPPSAGPCVCGPLSALCFYLTQDPLTPQPLGFLNLFLKICISVFIFGYAESSLLSRLFSSCGEWRLLSGCIPRASHCNGFPCHGARALGHSASVEAVDSGVAAPGLESTGSVV